MSSSVTPCCLQEWQAPNIGIPNDVSETGRRTYYSASTFSSYYQLSGMTDLWVLLFFFFSFNHFPSLPVAPSSTIFSKVAGDFLIARSKAIFYFSSSYHVIRISLFSELAPVDLSSYISDGTASVPDGFFFLLSSYHREPRDSIFWPFVLLSLLSFFVFPLNHAPFNLLCVCQRWHHALNHSDWRVWSYFWLCFPFLIQLSSHPVSYFFKITLRPLLHIVNWYNFLWRHWDLLKI